MSKWQRRVPAFNEKRFIFESSFFIFALHVPFISFCGIPWHIHPDGSVVARLYQTWALFLFSFSFFLRICSIHILHGRGDGIVNKNINYVHGLLPIMRVWDSYITSYYSGTLGPSTNTRFYIFIIFRRVGFTLKCCTKLIRLSKIKVESESASAIALLERWPIQKMWARRGPLCVY